MDWLSSEASAAHSGALRAASQPFQMKVWIRLASKSRKVKTMTASILEKPGVKFVNLSNWAAPEKAVVGNN